MCAADIKKLTPSRLREAIGPEATATLMRLFGGRTIPRQSMFHMERTRRRDEVRAHAAEHGYAAAAEAFALSERQVRRIVHGY